MMNRKEQIADVAEKFYLNNEQNNYEDERLYNAFIRGAEWADSNRFNDNLINKIIDLLYEANKEVRLHMVDGNISLNDARKMQVEYIKNYLVKLKE